MFPPGPAKSSRPPRPSRARPNLLDERGPCPRATGAPLALQFSEPDREPVEDESEVDPHRLHPAARRG